ncbi:MAG: AMP-binding protein [Pseudonocardiaceae bacterium]
MADVPAHRSPYDANTIRHTGGSMRYLEVADRATAVASALAQLGVRPGERVLIMLPDGPGFVEAFVGVIQRGAVPLPVNPLLQACDVSTIAVETGARLVVAVEEQIHALADLDFGPLVLTDKPPGLCAAVLRLS